MSPEPRAWVIAGLLALVAGGHARAQHGQLDDPYAYDLRTALFPVAFHAGIRQSHFGSAARAEFDLARWLIVQLAGEAGWANVAGETKPITFGVRAGLSLNFIDREETTPLAGTVFPDDTPAVGSRGPGADSDLDVPVASKLGGPRLQLPDQDRTLTATLRTIHSLRIGYDFARVVERARPDASDGSARDLLNRMHLVYLGYGWSSHWNLSAAIAGGEPRVGWRRFYVDALLTLPALTSATAIGTTAVGQADFFPLGARIGMEGAIDALLRDAPGIGFGYSLELGALPGRSGVEGYLLVGLGLALDARVRARPIR